MRLHQHHFSRIHSYIKYRMSNLRGLKGYLSVSQRGMDLAWVTSAARTRGINLFECQVMDVSSISKGAMPNPSASLQGRSHLLPMLQSWDERCWVTLRPRTWQERAPFQSASWSFFPSYLRGLASSPCFSGQSQEHCMEQLVGLLVILGDVCIFMKSKHFRVCCNWQTSYVFNIRL